MLQKEYESLESPFKESSRTAKLEVANRKLNTHNSIFQDTIDLKNIYLKGKKFKYQE